MQGNVSPSGTGSSRSSTKSHLRKIARGSHGDSNVEDEDLRELLYIERQKLEEALVRGESYFLEKHC